HLSSAADLQPRRRAAAGDIELAAESMDRMVMNILDISRSEDGRLVPRQGPIALAELVDEVAHAAERRARSAELRLEIQRGSGDDTVQGDRDLLRRVLENLIDNSIKCSAVGGVVSVAVRPAAAHVLLAVSDEGPGVPAGGRQRIFERYFQLE